MVLDLDRPAGGSDEEAADAELELEETIVYAQDVKCLLCGFVLGQLFGRPGLPPDARRFRPSAGQAVPPGFRAGRARCFRCAGPCFLDEVETSLRIGAVAFEKPRRGRKPKPRPGLNGLGERGVAP